jgi:putative FmdB family regulatory protein
MPTYIYACDLCNVRQEIWHTMKACDTRKVWCESCAELMHRLPQVAGIAIEARGWEGKNDGRGEYISQLEQTPNGKKSDFAHCRSHNELREKAAQVGMDVHKP